MTLCVMAGLGTVSDVVGGIVDILFPGADNEDVIREIHRTFTILYQKLSVIAADIAELERQIDWMNTQLQYAAVVNIIKTAVDLNQKIRTSTSPAEKQRRQDRFVEHCFSQGLLNAVNTLYNGITGQGAFTRNIMESYYRKSRGHRANVIKLGGRMVQLATGGLLALMSYEGIRRGPGGSSDMAKDYQPKMQQTRVAVQGAYNKCNTEMGQNIAGDMRDFINRNPRLSVFDTTWDIYYDVLLLKYDWVRLYIMGASSSRSHAKGPNAYVAAHGKYMRVAYVAPKSSPHLAAAQSVLNRATSDKPTSVCNQVEAQLNARRIPWHCIYAVRRRSTSSIVTITPREQGVFARTGGTNRVVVLK